MFSLPDLDDVLTMQEADKRYQFKYASTGNVAEFQAQMDSIETNTSLLDLNLYQPLLNPGDTKISLLTGLNNLFTTLNNNTSILDINLYEPLLNSGDTKISLLTGLSNYIDSKISGGSVSINNLSLDPFYCVGNFNTTLSSTHEVNFSHMVLNQVNTKNNLSGLRNISFGDAVFQDQGFYAGTGATADASVVSRSCRMFDFYLDLSNINNFDSSNNMVMLFVPDRILNTYDGFIYQLNFITNKPSVTKYNNHNIPNLYLLFRDHIAMSNSIFQNLFLAGTESASASKLNLCFLSKIKLSYPTTQYDPTITAYRVYMKPSSRLWNRCNGLKIKNLFFIPTVNGNIYNLDTCLSLYGDNEKTIDNLFLPNMDVWQHGGFVTVSGDTTWRSYYTSQTAMDYYTHSAPISLSNNASFDVFFQFLNSLYH